MQHLTAELRIGCLYRDIDRCELHMDDAVNICLLHICHGDIISLQK